MCRIAGIINRGMQQDETASLVSRMCSLQRNGGPDDEGIYEDGSSHLVFGHRRLSIIDMSSGGHQPMCFSNQRYVITYNGELYNYRELKAELKSAGCQFSSGSDTEVILAAYQTWGTDAFSRFSGMFAFVLFDRQENTVMLARDPGGIKPLYYACTKEGLAFASEVRALRCVPWLQQPYENWKVYFMAYGHLPEPVTALKYVKPLPKGSYIKYDISSGETEHDTFGYCRFLEKIQDRNEAISLVREHLETAVKRHLISDAPIGVFLSGGLDSSIIALLAAKHQQQLNTVSIYFDESSYSEKKYQDLLIERLGCPHNQLLVAEKDFHSFLPSIIASMDLPCCDGINTWFISRHAKQSGLKAVLSGIGGDELFGGYPSFERMKTAEMLSELPDRVLKAGRFSNSKIMRRLSYLSIKSTVGKYLFLRGLFIPSEIASFLSADEAEVWSILEEQPQEPDIMHMTSPNQASWLEINMYMQNQLLRDADVMSMAHGLEIRVPFLDKEFMQLVMKIQSQIKYGSKSPKQLLIDCFKDELPEPIWNRPKMGFSFPFREWLENNIYKKAYDGCDMEIFHSRLKKGEMHWSQFFAMQLLHSYGRQ